MKRLRPYIPISVRVRVAERQWMEKYRLPMFYGWTITAKEPSDKVKLETLLSLLFGRDGKPNLDHDPALILRKFNSKTGQYVPDANDPNCLVYREKANHQQKTTGRRPGAARTVTTKGSDIGVRNKFERLERVPRRKKPWPKRKFQ